MTSSNPASLMGLPAELRLHVFSYLLPTICVPSDYKHLRNVSRQIRKEFDHEVLMDISNYHNTIIRSWQPSEHLRMKLQWPHLRVLGCEATLVDTQTLRVSFPLPRKHMDYDYWSRAMCFLLHSLIPHVRYLKLYFHDDDDDSNNEEGSWRPVERSLFEMATVVSEYYRYRSRNYGWSSDRMGVRKVELFWGNFLTGPKNDPDLREYSVRKQCTIGTYLIVRPHVHLCNEDTWFTGLTHEVEISSLRGFKKWGWICVATFMTVMALDILFTIWKALWGLQRYIGGV